VCARVRSVCSVDPVTCLDRSILMSYWKRGSAAYSNAPAIDEKTFKDRLKRALEHPLFVVKVNPISDEHREFVIFGTSEMIYHVHIRTELSCDCPDATHNARKVTLCKHVIYTLVKCLGVDKDSEMLRRKHCRVEEIKALLSKARTVQRTCLADDRVRAAFDLHCEGKSRKQIEATLKGEAQDDAQQQDGPQSLAKRAREVVDEESECCVCYDTILKTQSLTWCRRECGRNFHHACFPESDTRVLTHKGFLYLDEIEERVLSWREGESEELLFACYDIKSQAICYRSGRIVYSKAPERWVDFTDVNGRKRWNGEETTDGAKSNRMSIRVTPNHQMYVQVGQRGTHQGELTLHFHAPKINGVEMNYQRIPAQELTPGFECSCTGAQKKPGKRSCFHGYDSSRFLSYASSGIAHVQLGTDQLATPKQTLKLETVDQLNAFLELYGYWLGDGTLSYHNRSVQFKTVKDEVYLKELIPRTGIPTDKWRWSIRAGDPKVIEFNIIEKSWFQYFDDEYWVHYKLGRDLRLPSGSSRESGSDRTEENKIALLERNGVPREDIYVKSAKWFMPWVLQCLNREQIRLVIEGLRVSDGLASTFENGSRIFTSSVSFRDSIVQACLHAGYSAFFTVNTTAGPRPSWRVSGTNKLLTANQVTEMKIMQPRQEFIQLNANVTSWAVHFTDLNGPFTRPIINTAEVLYDGTHRDIHVQRRVGLQVAVKDGNVVYTGTGSELAKLIGISSGKISAARKKIGRNKKARGFEIFTREDWDALQTASSPTSNAPKEQTAHQDCLYSEERDGRVWCVNVDHPDHLVIAQRAKRGDNGRTVQASRPIVIGNCMDNWLAYKRKTGEPQSCPNCRADPWILTDEQLQRLCDCPSGAAASSALTGAAAAAPSPYLDLAFAMTIDRPPAAAAAAAAAPSVSASTVPPVAAASRADTDSSDSDECVVIASPPAKKARV
jgi:hypothetical protein